jgi:hypothetical protein
LFVSLSQISQVHLRLCLCAYTQQLCIPCTHEVVALPPIFHFSCLRGISSNMVAATTSTALPPSSEARGHGRPPARAASSTWQRRTRPPAPHSAARYGGAPWRPRARRRCAPAAARPVATRLTTVVPGGYTPDGGAPLQLRPAATRPTTAHTVTSLMFICANDII